MMEHQVVLIPYDVAVRRHARSQLTRYSDGTLIPIPNPVLWNDYVSDMRTACIANGWTTPVISRTIAPPDSNLDVEYAKLRLQGHSVYVVRN